jgi:hypothetical protein
MDELLHFGFLAGLFFGCAARRLSPAGGVIFDY